MQARSILSGTPRPHPDPDPKTGFGMRPNVDVPPSVGPESDFFERVGIPPLLALILVLLMLVPIELSIRAGPILLPWYRAVLLVVALPIFVRAGRLRFAAFDYCVLGHTLWTMLCMLVNEGAAAIEAGGSYLVETLGVYLIARVSMTRPGHFTALPRLVFILMVPTILLAVPEAMILKSRFIHDFARQLTGYYYWVQMDYRMGMLRAASTFEHPILYGLFCAAPIPLVWVTARSQAKALAKTAILCGGTILSGSSAPLLVMLIGVMLLIGERVSRNIHGRFRLLVGSVVFCWAFLFVASDRGMIQIIAQELTLNPESGYYRILIWDNGIDDVLASPIFGITPSEWTHLAWMSSSIDNNWLLLAMKGGFPGIFLLLAAMLLIWWRLYHHRDHRAHVSPEFDRIRFGWSCVLLALFLGGATVAFFGKMQPFFFLLLGYGASLAHLETRTVAQTPAGGQQAASEKTGGKDVSNPPKRRTVL